jgi:threonylcarbamoyladenosine tRNA methylthiotransferase MtaB
MGRHWYTAARYAEAIERIVRDAPVFGLGADIIAGFPGETDDDHRATLSLVQSLPFTGLHVFPFSLRPGTPAERLPAHVPPTVARERARELRTLADQKTAAYRGKRVGGMADAVVIGSGARREGLTEDYLTVLVSDATLPRGERVRVRLEERGGEMWGVVVGR